MPHILQNKITDFNELYSPTLCHGTLGVAHIINKLFDLLGDDKLKATANYWYEQSNIILNSATGYKHLDDDDNFREKHGILHGIEGIGLALLSSIHPNCDRWDSIMLLS